MSAEKAGDWFVVAEGEHAGRLHLVGWLGSAFEVPRGDAPWQSRTGFFSYGVCPRCFAMVRTGEGVDDYRWRHERWHAATDHPVPAELTGPAPRTQEEKVAFREAWDARVDAGKENA